MKLPFLNADAKPGESPSEHVARLGSSRTLPPWVVAQGLAAYVGPLLDRVNELEQRVAALEKGR